MPVGGKPGETSSWTVPTPLLHVLSTGLRTSKSKGKKNTFNITVLENQPLSVSQVPRKAKFSSITVWQFLESSLFCIFCISVQPLKGLDTHSRLATAPAIIGCWLVWGGSPAVWHLIMTRYHPIGQCNIMEISGTKRIWLAGRNITHTSADGRDFFSRVWKWSCSLTHSTMDERNWYIFSFLLTFLRKKWISSFQFVANFRVIVWLR